MLCRNYKKKKHLSKGDCISCPNQGHKLPAKWLEFLLMNWRKFTIRKNTPIWKEIQVIRSPQPKTTSVNRNFILWTMPILALQWPTHSFPECTQFISIFVLKILQRSFHKSPGQSGTLKKKSEKKKDLVSLSRCVVGICLLLCYQLPTTSLTCPNEVGLVELPVPPTQTLREGRQCHRIIFHLIIKY